MNSSFPSTVNVAVVGAGAIGIEHIRAFSSHPRAKVVAVAETSAQRRNEAMQELGVPEGVADFHELLERDDIQVFSVALPNFLHVPVGIEIVDAGKHVLMEKPLATNLNDAARLVRHATESGVLFMVGQNYRFTEAAQTLKQTVEAGRAGKIYHAKATWMRRAGIPRIGSWFTQRQYAGGGCTFDIGMHMLDLAMHLMGDFDAVSVSGHTFAEFGPRGLADGSWGKSEREKNVPFDVEDLSVALIRLRSGSTILLQCSWAAQQAEADRNTVQLFGTDAGLNLNPLEIYHPGGTDYAVESLPMLPPAVSINRCHHFIDCVLGEARPYVPSAESLAVQRILDAIYNSSATGREVRLD